MSETDQIGRNAFQILALSGGGYKGLYTAEVISQIEKTTEKPFGSCFDLICGTSIGGIIALALATRDIAAESIVELLQEVGPTLFTPVTEPEHHSLHPKALIKTQVDKRVYASSGFTFERGVLAAKHGNEKLEQALRSIFGERTIADLKTRVLIPSVNWTKGGPQFFKTPHHPNFTTDAKRLLVDVAMATSAAPVYLPNYEFEHQVFVDGGLVGNAPGIFGVHEAEHWIADASGRDHYLLSIGALSSKITANQSQPLNKGLIQWKGGLFDLMMACQEQTAHFMLTHKMGERYKMIDQTISADQDNEVALDKADQAATDTLLGLAGISFQQHISQESLRRYLKNSAPDLDFSNTKGVVTRV